MEEQKKKEKAEREAAEKKKQEEEKARKAQELKEKEEAAAEQKKKDDLMSKKHSDLMKKAREAGLSEDEINSAEDNSSPKVALVDMIIQKQREKTTRKEKQKDSLEQTQVEVVATDADNKTISGTAGLVSQKEEVLIIDSGNATSAVHDDKDKKANQTWNPWGDEETAKDMGWKGAQVQQAASSATTAAKSETVADAASKGKYVMSGQGYPTKGKLLEGGFCVKLNVKKLSDVKAKCDKMPKCGGFVWNDKSCYAEFYADASKDPQATAKNGQQTKDRFLYLKQGTLTAIEAAEEILKDDVNAETDLAKTLDDEAKKKLG